MQTQRSTIISTLYTAFALGFSLLNYTSISFAADTTIDSKHWIADRITGCQVWNDNPRLNESIKWSGTCVNNIAQGFGTLQWYLNGKEDDRYVGNLVDGRHDGIGTYTWVENHQEYQGEWKMERPYGFGTNNSKGTGIFMGDRLIMDCPNKEACLLKQKTLDQESR